MPHHGQQPQLGEHGADLHTDVTRELFIHAYDDTDPDGTLDNEDGFVVIELADGVAPSTRVNFKVPDDFVSFISIEAVWFCLSAAGDMNWTLSATYGAAGEAVDTHVDAGLLGVTATGGADIINVQEGSTPLVMANLALGDYVGIKLLRVSVAAEDTLDAIVYVIGFLLTYTAEQ